MKKEIEIKLFGLNELGVNELNEHYKHNIEVGYIKPYQVGNFKNYKKRKRIKQVKSFQNTGLDTYMFNVDLAQHIPGNEYHGPYFSLQLKHFKHEIYEVELVETFKKIS